MISCQHFRLSKIKADVDYVGFLFDLYGLRRLCSVLSNDISIKPILGNLSLFVVNHSKRE